MSKLTAITLSLLLAASSSVSANEWQSRDKHLHAATSAGIGLVAYPATDSVWQSLGICLGIGLAKELYDYQDYGTFSARDMGANTIGCGVGIGVGYLFFGHNNGLKLRF